MRAGEECIGEEMRKEKARGVVAQVCSLSPARHPFIYNIKRGTFPSDTRGKSSRAHRLELLFYDPTSSLFHLCLPSLKPLLLPWERVATPFQNSFGLYQAH